MCLLRSLFYFFICFVSFLPTLRALGREDVSLPFGSALLGKGHFAPTLALGFDLPSVSIYALRFDVGLLDRLQMGFSTNYLPKTTNDSDAFFNFAMHNKAILIHSPGFQHFLSFHLDPFFTYIQQPGRNPYIFSLSPAIGYEFVFAHGKSGLFARLGTTHVVGSRGANGNNSFELFTLSTRKGTHLLNAAVGYERRMAELFLLGIEAGLSTRLTNRNIRSSFEELLKANQFPFIKVYLSLAF